MPGAGPPPAEWSAPAGGATSSLGDAVRTTPGPLLGPAGRAVALGGYLHLAGDAEAGACAALSPPS
eukprot:15477558-Alexandrium_andersonii.AAC.1